MLRTSSLIGALVARGYDVTLYSMVGRKSDYLARKPSGTETIRDGLREYVDRGASGLPCSSRPTGSGCRPSDHAVLTLRMPRKLRELLASCDAVIIDFPFLFPPRQGNHEAGGAEHAQWSKPSCGSGHG